MQLHKLLNMVILTAVVLIHCEGTALLDLKESWQNAFLGPDPNPSTQLKQSACAMEFLQG